MRGTRRAGDGAGAVGRGPTFRLGLGIVAAIAALDWWTGAEVAPEIFYVIPVALAAWFSGRGPALVLSGAAALGWLLVGWLSGRDGVNAWIPLWNAGAGFLVLLTLTLALASVRRNLDEHARLVEALHRSLRAQRAAREELARRSRELERSNAELEQFAYAAAHDLKSPLVAVGGFVQLARRHLGADADPKVPFCLDEALGGVRRMEALIEDLLAYAKAGAGTEPREPADTAAAVAEALDNLRGEIEGSGAQVSVGELPRVVARHRELVQLFQNLLGNGLKFRGDEPPRVHVGVERSGEEEVFFVRDNGTGIDPADARRVFGLFQRLPGASRTPGTGIGLAVCKKIVESLGGRIWVESRRGEGATFRFTLRPADKG